MRRLLGNRGAARQSGRLRRPGPRRGIHRVAQRKLLGRDGAAPVRDCRAVTCRRNPVLVRRAAVTIEILVNIAPRETRAAIIESDVLQEIYVERTSRRGLVSNVYKGRVSRVLPGMQAAFVDIGLERTAFLHAADIANVPPHDTTI